MSDKRYLGDGVYIETDPYGFKLTTNNGIEDTNVVMLEPQVVANLIDFLERIKRSKS